MTRPEGSRVGAFIDDKSAGFILPRGVSSVGIVLLAFAILWIFVVGAFVIQPDGILGNGDIGRILIMMAFCIAGIGILVAALFILFSKTSILIDFENVRLARDLFGKSFVSRRKTRAIAKVENAVLYVVNNRPVYGVKISFLEERPLKFGSQLTEGEREWIISEIENIWRKAFAS